MDKKFQEALAKPREMVDKIGTIQEFIDSLPDHELEFAQEIAETLLDDGPLSPCVVIIPVAAHQEAHNVYHAVSEYARQDTTEPFSVVLFMNSTEEQDDPGVQKTLSEFNRAKNDFPALDVRMAYQRYLEPTIGEIRRDAWTGVAIAGVEGGTITDTTDILGVNHDIDLVRLPRHFMRAVQARQKDELRILSPAHTPVRHAPVANYDNVNRVIMWDEALNRVLQAGYEAGTVIPLMYYARKGGVNSEDSKSEILNLIGNDASGGFMRSGWTQTSGRRYVEKLHLSNSPQELWSSSEFLTTENYRSDNHDIKDITEKQFEKSIKTSIDKRMPQAVLAVSKETSRKILLVTFKDELSDDHKIAAIAQLLFRQYKFNRNLLDKVMRISVQSKRFEKRSVASIYSDAELARMAVILAENQI